MLWPGIKLHPVKWEAAFYTIGLGGFGGGDFPIEESYNNVFFIKSVKIFIFAAWILL